MQAPDFSMRSGGQQKPIAKVKPKNTGQTLKQLWTYLSQHKKGIYLVLFYTTTATILQLIAPFLLGIAIDDYILPKNWNGLLELSALLALIHIGTAIFSWLQQKEMVGVALRTVEHLRLLLFAKLQKLPIPYFDRKKSGELMSRVTNDMENVSTSLTQSTTGIISSIISLVGSMIIMLYMNVWLALLCMVTIPLVMLFTKYVTTFTRKHFAAQQKHLGQLNGFIEETVSGKKVIQITQREQHALHQFNVMNKQLTEASISAQIYTGLVGPIMNVLNHFSFAIIAAIGGWMVFREFTTVGVIVAFMNYSKQFQRPINELANQFNMIQAGIAGAERAFEVINEQDEYTAVTIQKQSSIIGDVKFENVSFSYSKAQPILNQITIHAKPGQTVALVGPTGAGKTTVISLLTRFYDSFEGDILIDGKSISQFAKDELRAQLGIVLQDAHLFTETVLENIRYGRLTATEAEVIAAAKAANAHRFISDLPHGYYTVLAQDGSNLSQGQKQLIAIARALLANPAILILDEATSSIDTRTEMQVQQAIQSLLKGRTSFVIAHRLSTIREADQILFIDKGQIIEQGTHEQLLAQKGRYEELYRSQFKRVEATD